jgi:hypothetical protein
MDGYFLEFYINFGAQLPPNSKVADPLLLALELPMKINQA